MADPVPTAAPAPVAAAASVATSVESRVAALEAKAKSDVSKVAAFLKANWAHFVTWAGVAYSLYKHL
jgi:hypothetical protein